MSRSRLRLVPVAVIALSSLGSARAQIGSIQYPLTGGSALLCSVYAAGTPELRPEGLTEILGDVTISCTGGQPLPVGSMIPTVNIAMFIAPSVPVTSRILDDHGASEAVLMIDEPGSYISGPAAGYGPSAVQSLCTSAQQQSYLNPCQAAVSTDGTGQFQVAVVPGTATPAQNVFQGKVGDFGPNTVAFYGVPILPPVYTGLSRTFRISNVRIPTESANIVGIVAAVVSVSPGSSLPLTYQTSINVGVVGPSTAAAVTPRAALGTCVPVATPTVASRVTFTEGFATSFKTRVVPGGLLYGLPIPHPPPGRDPNFAYAGQAQNLTAPFNQNIPGGLYSGDVANVESGFILAQANATISSATYTAGLTDFGTRLKAVFSNIPAGVTVWVSTANAANYAVPGGTSMTPYAVLVAAGQGQEGNGDGANFAPLASTVAGSDGLAAYPLTADTSGVTAAVWEVVNASPIDQDSLTFSVYVTFASTPGTATNPTFAALTMAPEPGGGTFSGIQPLTSPVPRFSVPRALGGQWATINGCSLQVASAALPFVYALGTSSPPSQTLQVITSPANLPVTVTPSVSTPTGGNWLMGSASGGTLTIAVNPSGLAASTTAYTGNLKLSAPGVSDVLVPVNLLVNPGLSGLSIRKTHAGDFVPGQAGATYSIVVSNSASAQPTQGPVTVTEQVQNGLTVSSMAGAGWDCSTPPYCKRSDPLATGASWPAITVAVNVSPTPPPRVVNIASVSGGASADGITFDVAATGALACTVTGDQVASVADARALMNEALGIAVAADDLNADGALNVADLQIVVKAVMGKGCPL